MTAPIIVRNIDSAMGQAVAERTIFRKKSDGKLETWGDVAKRVSIGNASLCPDQSDMPIEQQLLEKHIAKASLLMSGRHLQHGDENQINRNLEIFVNCATSPTSFLMFLLLLNGAGVGRSYDESLMVLDWDNAPNLRVVLDDTHPDFDFSAHESVRDAMHKYGPDSKKVMWFKVGDSREGWAKALEIWELSAFEKIHRDKMLILDFSDVRANGSPIGGMQNRPASGPVPLMNAFLKAASLKGSGIDPWKQAMYVDHFFAECVLVGGARRAARIATKYWKDLSIFGFIEVKRPIEFSGLSADEVVTYRNNTPNQPFSFLWSSNNSVMVDKEFWNLLDIKRGTDGYMDETTKHARKVWKRVTECSYGDGTGEPAFINVDKLTVNNDGLEDLSRGDYVGYWKYQVQDETQIMLSKLAKKLKKMKYPMIVNPCVTSDTWINTADGPRQVAELIDIPFKAIVNGKSYNATGFWETGTKPVIKVSTQRGYFIRATGNHKILVETDRSQKLGGGYNVTTAWVEVDDLKIGDRLVLSDNGTSIVKDQQEFDHGWLLGQMVGDGGFNPSKYNGYVRFWGTNKEEMASRALSIIKTLPLTSNRGAQLSESIRTPSEHNSSITQASIRLDVLAAGLISEGSKNILPSLEKQSQDFIKGFISGLFDADGSVSVSVKNGRSIRLHQSNVVRLEAVQRMLARIGIAATIYNNRREAGMRELPNGAGGSDDYYCQATHDLVISKSNMNAFQSIIGFQDGDHRDILATMLALETRGPYQERFTTSVSAIEPDGEEKVYDCTVDEVHRFDANGIIVHNCAEITISALGAFCTIADVVPFFADTIDDAEEAFRVATRALIRVNTMPSIYQKEVTRTNRIGVGMTGIHEFAWKYFRIGFASLVDPDFDGYSNAIRCFEDVISHDDARIRSAAFWMTINRFGRAVVDESEIYSAKLGVVTPHTSTTCKPAGSTSKLFGLTEGCHLPAMEFYLRWVQFRHDDPLIQRYKDEGYPVKTLTTYEGTVIVGFPTAPTIATLGMNGEMVTAAQATPEDQYKWLMLLEKYYLVGANSDTMEVLDNDKSNQLSYTLKYDPDKVDIKQFRDMMKEYQPKIKACSVMPMTDTSAYEYLPETSISKAAYEEIVRAIKHELEEDVGLEHLDCETGACPISFDDGEKGAGVAA